MEIVPLTIWREARGEGPEGMNAVLHVIHNRTNDKRYSSDPERVCLQPYQFSCWNSADPQRALYPKGTDQLFQIALDLIAKLVVSSNNDPTNGALYYVNPKAITGANPFANNKFVQTAIIGNHVFYTDAPSTPQTAS